MIFWFRGLGRRLLDFQCGIGGVAAAQIERSCKVGDGSQSASALRPWDGAISTVLGRCVLDSK